MSHSAIAGQFVRFSSLSDGTLRLVVDVPHEYAHHVLATLGFPAGQSVAIALLSGDASHPPSPSDGGSRPSDSTPDSAAARPRTPWHELPRSKQAAIRCGDEQFRTFLVSERSMVMLGNPAECVRRLCGVGSRSELDVRRSAAASWDKLDAEYRRWAGLETEPRG